MKNTVILFLLLATSVFANGTRIPSQDANVVARGYANVASSDAPSSIYYNPAGLSNLTEQELQLNVYTLTTNYKHAGEEAGATFVVPAFFVGVPVHERITLGWGVYYPYGLETDWSKNSSFSTLATKNSVEYQTIAIAASVKLTETLKLGVAFEESTNKTELNQNLFPGPGAGMRVKGEDDSPSFTVGLQWSPSDKHHFGISYHSKTDFDLKGTTYVEPLNTTTTNKFKWEYPEHVSVGYSYRPTRKWNFELNYEWTNWERLNSVTVESAGLPNTTLPFNWKSSSYTSFGTTYYVTDAWSVSGGVSYSTNSIPDASYNPAIPDMNKYFFNTGTSYKTKNFTFSLALEVSPTETRTITGQTPNFFGESANGKYTSNMWSISSGVSYRF